MNVSHCLSSLLPSSILSHQVIPHGYSIWDDQLLEDVIAALKADLPLSESAPGGMISFRRTLTISFFYKFYLSVRRQLAAHTQVSLSLLTTHR